MAAGRTPRHVRRAKGARRKKAAPSASMDAASSSVELVPGRARLQKILAAAGLGSRRATEQYLREGRVTVNGRPAQLGDSADPASDVIAVDGEKLAVQRPAYWILHKPVGVVTTMSDPEGRPTVAGLLPPRAAGVFPVGRLDVETTGLVLMTNDGAMAQTLLHPATGGEKEYRVVVKGELGPADAARLERGIVLEDGRTKPARIDELHHDADRGVTRLRLVITEGRNRQIRRMMQAIGRPVKSLMRTRIGPVTLGRLRRGEARPLRPGEVAALQGYVARLRSGEEPGLAARRPARAPASARGGGASQRRSESAPRTRGGASPQTRVARKGTRKKKASRRPSRK